MVNQSFRFVDGIAKNVHVQINDHYIPTDFLFIDMGEDEYDPPIILGRPFLFTTKVIIYLITGEVHFQFPFDKVRRYFNNNYIVDEEPKKNRTRRRHHNCTQKNQIPKDGWADCQGEVSRYEDQFSEDDKTEEQVFSSKSTSPTKHV
jgi:hypothetical protein